MKRFIIFLALIPTALFSMEIEVNASSAVDAAVIPYTPVNEENKEKFFVLKCPYFNELTTTKKTCCYKTINKHPSAVRRCSRIKEHINMYHHGQPIPDNDTLKQSYIIPCTSFQEATEVVKRIASPLEKKTNISCYVLQCPLFKKPTKKGKLCNFLKINFKLYIPDFFGYLQNHFKYCHYGQIPDNDTLKQSYIIPCTSLLEAEILRDSLKKKSDSLVVPNDKHLEIGALLDPPIASKDPTLDSYGSSHPMEKEYGDSEAQQILIKQLNSSPNKKRNNGTDSRDKHKKIKGT